MKTKLGWIGLGKMGIPMSSRLIEAEYHLTVYNRTPEKTMLLKSKGAKVAESPSRVLDGSEVVFLMVSDDQAVREIFTGENGLLHSGAGNRIIINMSTVSAEISREMSELCSNKGHHYLDAPVSGSVKQAERGELVIMAGGDKSVFDGLKPLLDQMAKLSLHVGPTGSGNTMKLAVNLLLGIISQGLSEAVILTQKHGLDTAKLLEVIAASALGNIYMKIKGDAILNRNFDAAFALKHIAKDLRLARDAGLDSPVGMTVLDTFEKAEKQFAAEDIIAVFKYLKS